MDDREYSYLLPREVEFRGVKLQRKKTGSRVTKERTERNVRQ